MSTRSLAALLAALLALTPLARAAELDEVPPELEPWIPWVLHDHPDLGCPVVDGKRVCLWPGSLVLDADDEGARFELSVQVDRDMTAPLPGGPGAWPRGVRVDGLGPGLVRDVDGVPQVWLSRGTHRVSGRISWSDLPQGIAVPPTVARVELTVGGRPVDEPRIDAGGTLRLGMGASSGPADDRLDLEVSRRIEDGVPLGIATRVVLRASGAGREVDLGEVLIEGTRPVSLQADLPARITADGHLVVQVRPGSYTATLHALHDGPAEQLVAPTLPAPWPERETWAVATDDRVRTVNLSGPVGVDPARTTLPDEWRGLPTFLVQGGEALFFEELRRGDPVAAPNRMSLHRDIWLDLDGGGYTISDRFSGRMSRTWRLDLRPPAELGHVEDHGVAQVVTRSEVGAGVEVRDAEVDLVAESRVRRGALHAVGWAADVAELSVELNLPPGWELLAVLGADSAESLLGAWSLWDLFFVLILSMATARLAGFHWGAIALLGLSLARHQSAAPAWTWALLLVALAMVRVLPEGKVRAVFQVMRWAVVVVLFLLLLPFSVHQVESGMFPVLESPRITAVSPGPHRVQAEQTRYSSSVLRPDEDWRSEGEESSGEEVSSRFLTQQQDPTAVVQTGPGVPSWSWEAHQIAWSGPVTADQQLRPLLVGPRINLLLALLRVGLLLMLALRLSEVRRIRLPGARELAVTGVVAAGVLSGPALGQEPPDEPALLDQLEARLTEPAPCLPHCVTVPELAMEVSGDRLAIRAEVHAAAEASWPVPGPASSWVPERAVVDGRPWVALARQEDGLVHLRLPRGVHQVLVDGPLPPGDSLTLQLGLPPRHLSWSGEGWTLDGVRADGTAQRSVQLTRVLEGGEAGGLSSENLTPWLEVRRSLDLGLPWRVHTEVTRVGPSSHPLALRVPLLTGEAVTTEGVEVVDGEVLVALDRARTSVEWISTLDESEVVVLGAPEDVPWTEVWTLSCSPVFSCSTSGLPPLRHVHADRWSPQYRPWPAEELTLTVSRPGAVPGQTVTVDRVDLDLAPGRRLAEASLSLEVRASQGGKLDVHLPEGARLQSVRVDQADLPIQARGDVLPVPLQPGTRSVELTWQEPSGLWAVYRVPRVELGAPAVDVEVVVRPPEGRWILALFGPPWGPVPVIWSYVVVVLLAAPLLARLPWAPLRTWQWALLGLGMTQVPVIAPAMVLLWFVALGARAASPARSWWRFDLVQLFLILLTPVALGCLYAAVQQGLLVPPDMQIAGHGSSSSHLHWYVDRVATALPRPLVLSLPLWVWRVVMLLWSLWLAASLVRWLPWAWRCFVTAGGWRMPVRKATASRE